MMEQNLVVNKFLNKFLLFQNGKYRVEKKSDKVNGGGHFIQSTIKMLTNVKGRRTSKYITLIYKENKGIN